MVQILWRSELRIQPCVIKFWNYSSPLRTKITKHHSSAKYLQLPSSLSNQVSNVQRTADELYVTPSTDLTPAIWILKLKLNALSLIELKSKAFIIISGEKIAWQLSLTAYNWSDRIQIHWRCRSGRECKLNRPVKLIMIFWTLEWGQFVHSIIKISPREKDLDNQENCYIYRM